MSDYKKSFDASELSVIKKVYLAGVQPCELAPFGRHGLIEEELEVVFDCFKAGLSDEKIKFILETAEDFWTMDNILVGFKAGISFDEMKSICSDPDYGAALDSRTSSLLEEYAKDKLPVADQFLALYHPNTANLSPAAIDLLRAFRTNYIDSGYMYSGCLKKEDILASGHGQKGLSELLNANLISRRDCVAESYELSLMERFSLIRFIDMLALWEKHGGDIFYLNNGYHGEFHRVLREVLASAEKEKTTLDSKIGAVENGKSDFSASNEQNLTTKHISEIQKGDLISFEGFLYKATSDAFLRKTDFGKEWNVEIEGDGPELYLHGACLEDGFATVCSLVNCSKPALSEQIKAAETKAVVAAKQVQSGNSKENGTSR